ncbi:uncharacterized protein PV06_11286 [Exophiala oligosperma]|uniref:Uncharacterized protein n=1 Tax=Exophiala oligosperma TaxID=215243 RepID=A0A0D2A835_9EURO|nr:uncharacterized protein PV06_11286 [Exophiala oligosperma]KIW36471.1 hypothetical protein PV06_11286 [Exophiala oligosperma]
MNVQAPSDTVLQNSAQGFLQGLYPPVGSTLGIQQLHNGSSVQAPLNGYQLIPISTVTSLAGGTNSENTAWLQGASGCNNAIISSNNYFLSSDFQALQNSTASFYQSLNPVVNGTFTATYNTYKNAYSVLLQLRTLADHHEFSLAYNASDPIRAIAGSTLAGQILQQLNNTITTKSAVKFNIQFSAYGTFSSFFSLAQLAAFSPNFTAVVDYASSMTFELATNATVSNTSYPAVNEISVRFLFANGSAALNGVTAYPLFGQSSTTIPYNSFATWCSACGNSTDVCASTATSSSSSSSSSSSAAVATTSSSSSGGMSLAVAGVIGAMVTLAVILGLEALILLLAGLRVVSKKGLGAAPSPAAAILASPVKA